MAAAYRLLYETLVKFGCVERTLFSSFGHSWLRDLKAQYPDLRTGLLYAGDPKTPEETLELVRTYNADAILPICTPSTRTSWTPAWRTGSMSTSGRWILQRISPRRCPMA